MAKMLNYSRVQIKTIFLYKVKILMSYKVTILNLILCMH